jgi:hypothetical protein
MKHCLQYYITKGFTGGDIMSSILDTIVFVFVSGVVMGIAAIIACAFQSKKREHPDEQSHEQATYIIKPTITKEFYVTERSYREVAPEYITVSPSKKCYEATYNGIGYLNYRTYCFSARFTETKRMRKREIKLFDDCDVSKKIQLLGYTDPISYEPVSPEVASENQLSYMSSLIDETSCVVKVPLDKLCRADASGLIYYMTEGGHTPSADIIEYASELHIEMSFCYPDWLVFEKIYNNLSQADKIAFFIFCVYRDTYKPSCENPNKSPCHNLFMDFSNEYSKDERFLKSWKTYYTNGHQIVHFGETTDDYYRVPGGSKRTLAYKTASDFLSSQF